MTKSKDNERDWVEEYEELTKNALREEPKEDERTEEFMERVLGKELKAWMDRAEKWGYGFFYDEDGNVVEDWPEED